MPSGLSQSHQEIAGQFQRELLQLICLGSGGQHVQRPLPRGMGRPIGLQCPCNSFTRQEVRGASDSTNQRIENNALVSSSGITGCTQGRLPCSELVMMGHENFDDMCERYQDAKAAGDNVDDPKLYTVKPVRPPNG